jgi:Tfp pilus assembly protein PilO
MQAAKKPRSWVLTLVLAGTAIGYVAFVFLPGQRAVGEMRRQLHEKQQFIVQADRLSFAIAKATEDVQAAHEFAEAWRSQAPSEARLAVALGRFTDHAQAAGLSVRRFDPQPPVKLETVWHSSLALAVEGSYGQMLEFLRLVESESTTTWIENLRLETAREGAGRLHCEMTLRVFADNPDFSE